MSRVSNPVIDECIEKPSSVENGGRDNAGFDKMNYDDVSSSSAIKSRTGDKILEPESVPSSAGDAEGKKKGKDETVKAVGLFELFRFADKIDVLLMIIATLGAIAHGAGMPVLLLVFGNMSQKFINYASISANTTLTPEEHDDARDDFLHNVGLSSAAFAGIGGGVLIVAYGQVAFWLMTSHRQTFKIRSALLRAVLRQEISWFDTNDSGGISSRLSDDINKIQEGFGDKMGAFFQWTSMFVIGLIIALAKGWKMALVCLSLSPITAMCGAIVMKLITSSTTKELAAYSKAGTVATEVFSCIKTVLVFGGQEKECDRYGANLVAAKKKGIQKSIISGAGIGSAYFVIFCTYCLAFWYGGKLVRQDEIDVGTMVTVFFSVLFASIAIGHASPSMQAVGEARAAAYYVWNLIDRKPEIDSSSNNGICPQSLTGNLEFRNIHFHYPSRPDVPILNGLTLSVRSGQTVALVGGSGCGKSTVVQLLQRFYDPREGSVFVDGNDVKKLNIRWLRQQIGIVSQEPVLFAMSIADNIRFGRDDVTQADIERAAEEANAHSFISELPEKYDTMVGERGAQLSGGQKQRIAIARALVRNPKILLLDEATSALDTESEAIVQSALDKAREGRTTIVIAHRLSTIRTADVIYGLKQGKVHEFGTHEELMEMEGIYYQLVTSQQTKENETDEDKEDDEEFFDVELTESELMSRGSLRRSRHSQRGSMRSATGVQISEGQNPEEKGDAKKPEEVSLSKLLHYNAPEWYYIVIGCICSVMYGGLQPVPAILFGSILGVFGPDHTDSQRAHDIRLYALMYLVIGVGAGFTYFFSVWLFGLSGEALTMRLRLATFKALLRQDMSFFDNPRNGAGALSTRLATDASAVQGATGIRLGMMLQTFATIGVGVVIAFIYSWKFALFVFGIMPFKIFGSLMQIKIAKGFSMKNKSDLEEAGKVAIEAISNIRTVASLNKEDRFAADYVRLLEPSYRQNLKMSHVNGFAFSFTQAMLFFTDAAIFYFGAWLVAHTGLKFDSMFKVFGAVLLGAVSIGRESQFAPDYGRAKTSAAQIFALLEKKPRIDNYSTEGHKPNNCAGRIELKNVEFCYPNRPTVKVMKGTNLMVEPGQTFALVGQTGCGKSTTIQLLERLYDPSAGQVLLDGVDVSKLNISWLRSQLGLVSQEPVLFDYSIRENIEYGDNSRKVTMDEVIAAARAANIHNFIQSLPDGYETRVGDKGTQLSGGQKQRIAIARALVRNPKILLLDEATSALDTESEKIVQEALDRAQHGRTCLVIAHRLSTIQNANRIVVFHQGRVAEQGTHTELMNLQQGLYYKLQHTNAK